MCFPPSYRIYTDSTSRYLVLTCSPARKPHPAVFITALGEIPVPVEFCQTSPCTKEKKSLFAFPSPPQPGSTLTSSISLKGHLRSAAHNPTTVFAFPFPLEPRRLGGQLHSFVLLRVSLMAFRSQKSQKSFRRFHTRNKT